MFGETSINPQLRPTFGSSQNEAEKKMFTEALNKMTNAVTQNVNNKGQTYNIGDVTLEVNDLKDVLTLDQFVSVIKKAKAFS